MERGDIDVLESALESLRPRRNEKIMDLVAKAGIDIEPWSVKKDGSVVKNPGTNPAYCFRWAFGGDGEPTALCIWHSSLVISQGLVLYEDNIREYASKLYRIATDRSQPQDFRTRARKQEKRAQEFDSLLQRAFRRSEPVRVILLLGGLDSESEFDWDTSKVQYRTMDSEVWYVHSYSDSDGSCRLVRKVPPDGISTENDTQPSHPVFVDQFTLLDRPGKHESAGFIFDRSPQVRRAVLERAAGVCECCAAPGFKMDNGDVFLETHHVIPLSQNGPDEEWNVVAICPNDHRRAHFSEERMALRDQLIKYLLATYPFAEDAFRTLLDTVSDPTLTS